MLEVQSLRFVISGTRFVSIDANNNCAETITISNNVSKILTFSQKQSIKHHILDSTCNIVLRIQKMALLSAINDFRKTVAGQIAGATMMGIAAAASVSGTAMAGDGQIAFHKFQPTDSNDYIEFSSANASAGRISITVYSGDDNMLSTAYKVAQDIERDSRFDVYFLQAPSVGPVTHAVIKAHGETVGNIRNGGNAVTFKEDLESSGQRAVDFLSKIPVLTNSRSPS